MTKRVLFLLLFLYTVFGFFILPYILKSTIINNVKLQTNAKAKIDSIYFNPFTFKLRVNKLELLDAKNKKLLFLKKFELNLEPHSFVFFSINLKEIKLENPTIFLVYDKDEKINFNKILKEEKQKKSVQKENSFIPRIIIDKMSIVGGNVFYQDNSTDAMFETSLKDLDFTLKDLDTKNILQSDTKLKLNCKLKNNGLLKIDTDVTSLKPLILDGFITLKTAKLYTEYEYIKNNLNIEVADGELNLNTHFLVNINDLNNTQLDNFSATISKLRIKPKKIHEDILTLKSLSVAGTIIYPFKNRGNIKNITLNGLDLDVKMDKKGEIDWSKYIKTEFKNSDKNISKIQKNNASKIWDLSIKNITLKNIGGNFEDKSVYPSVLTKINYINLDIKNLTLLKNHPFPYDLQLFANDKFKCHANGKVINNILNISSNLKCSNFDIIHYKPYIDRLAKQNLKRYNLDLKSASLGFESNIDIKDENNTISTYIDDANLTLNDFKLNKKTTRERLVSFKNLSIKNIKVNTKQKDVKIAQAKLKYLSLNPKRYSNGSFNIENLVIPKKTKNKTSKSYKASNKKEYRVRLKDFIVQYGQVNFRDRVLKPSLKTRLNHINIKLSNIDSKNINWIRYSLNAKLNNNGYIKSYGKLKHSPMRQSGKLELKNLRLKAFSPYIENQAFVKLDNGLLNLKSKFNNEKLSGSLKLDSLFLNDSRDNSTVFAVNKLDINSFNLSSKQLFIDDINLDSFYLNAVINKDNSMNFSRLIKDVSKDTSIKKSTEKKLKTEKFSIWVLESYIKNGNASFTDNSLPIDFSTQIHDVNGMIYALSSLGKDTSYVDLVGEIDAYGSTKLKGSTSFADIKKYTDLDFNFRNLNLKSVTGYSAKFAGHEIDSGKLFLNLHYDIQNSKLRSTNSIVVKNIKLGKDYKDENTTLLPLGFFISLLEDSDGVIDIDMPIKGNVDKPNFKYGALVMKTFFKLIGNAITSPFRFLGSILGVDGGKLSFIEYETGKSSLLPSEREKLDNLAKIMVKKPKIIISLAATYDKKFDIFELKKEKLIKLLVSKGKLKSKINNINMMNISLLEDICDEFNQKYSQKELSKKEYRKSLIDKCINLQVVNDSQVKNLVDKRIQTIVDYLVIKKNIDPLRFKLKETKILDGVDKDFVKVSLNIELK